MAQILQQRNLQMEKEDMHKKIRPIRPNLEMPLLSIVKKDVYTQSPLFLFQSTFFSAEVSVSKVSCDTQKSHLVEDKSLPN